MRRSISGFGLLVAAAMTGPAQMGAAEYAIGASEPAASARDDLRRPHSLAAASGDKRPATVRVAAGGGIEQGSRERHFGRSDLTVDRRSLPAPRVRDDSGGASGAWASLDIPSGTAATGTAAAVDPGRRSASPSSLPIPEPGNWAMLIAGLLGVWTVARRRMSSI